MWLDGVKKIRWREEGREMMERVEGGIDGWMAGWMEQGRRLNEGVIEGMMETAGVRKAKPREGGMDDLE